MKPAFLISFILTLFFFNERTIAQESLKDSPHEIGYFIGKLNGTDIYSRGNYLFPKNTYDPFALVTLEGKSIKGIYSYSGRKENYHNWFIHQNQLYSISSLKTTDPGYTLQLKEYDKNFHIIDSTILFHDAVEQYKHVHISFKQDGNSIAVVGMSGMGEGLGFVAMLDLDKKELLSKSFSIDGLNKYICVDFTWNKQHKLIAVFEGRENMYPGDRTLKETELWKTYLMHLSATETVFTTIPNEMDDMAVRSFKLLKVNEQDVIIGGLTFIKKKTGKHEQLAMHGYYKSLLEFDISGFRDNQFLEAKTVFDPSLWINPQLNDFEDGSYYKLSNLFLKEIRFLDNDLLFVSETQKVQTGQATNSSMPSDSHSVTNNFAAYIMDEDIIISRISEDSVNWTTKPRFIYERPPALTHDESYHLTHPVYFLPELTSDKLTLYYSDDHSIFTDEGKLIEEYPVFGSSNSLVVKFEVNLSTGKSQTTAAHGDFKSRKYEEVNASGSYEDETGIKLLTCSHKVIKFKYKVTDVTK